MLWKKCDGKCFLCGGVLNRASDYIVPDHDKPVADEGPTTLANLNLAHSGCNSWKRNHPTAPASAFLSDGIRTREVKVVNRILNQFVDIGLRPTTDPPHPSDLDAIQRRKYQSSLAYMSSLMRKVTGHLLNLEEKDCLGAVEPTPQQWEKIEEAIARVVEHPVWKQPFNSPVMQEVSNALSKNQNGDKAFKKAGLDLGYALTGELEPDWAGQS